MTPEIKSDDFWKKIEGKKVVFLLGSGFTVDAGFPSMKTLSDEAVSFFKTSTNARSLYDCYSVLGLNLTDFWTFMIDDQELEKSVNGNIPVEKLESGSRILKEFIAKSLYKRLWKLHIKLQDNNCPYKQFFEKIDKSSTIITTNWDLLTEYFWKIKLGRDYSYADLDTESENTKLTIIKIHGSINWMSLEKFEGLLKREPCFTQSIGGSLTQNHQDFFSEIKKIWYHEDVTNFIMPPFYQKDYTAEPYDSLLKEGLKAIEACDYVIVIGYSFAREDRFLSSLVRRAIVRNVASKNNNNYRLPTFIIDPNAQQSFERLGQIINTNNYLKATLIKQSFYSFFIS